MKEFEIVREALEKIAKESDSSGPYDPQYMRGSWEATLAKNVLPALSRIEKKVAELQKVKDGFEKRYREEQRNRISDESTIAKLESRLALADKMEETLQKIADHEKCNDDGPGHRGWILRQSDCGIQILLDAKEALTAYQSKDTPHA